VGPKGPERAVVVAEGARLALNWRDAASWKRARRRNPAAGLGIPDRRPRRDTLVPFPLPSRTPPPRRLCRQGTLLPPAFSWSSGLGSFGLPVSVGDLTDRRCDPGNPPAATRPPFFGGTGVPLSSVPRPSRRVLGLVMGRHLYGRSNWSGRGIEATRARCLASRCQILLTSAPELQWPG
jgi:hypothetical protein